jgi:F420-0:gamma-glutamyl ligase
MKENSTNQKPPTLYVQPIRTRLFHEGEELANFIIEHITPELIREKMVIAVTSKIVSLAEQRLVARDSITKADLVEREAEVNLGHIGYDHYLTIKHGLFIPSAGIDESNSEDGSFILYPVDPFLSAKSLWSALKKKWQVSELGIVMTDSHTTPLRRGVTGISLAHWGFHGLKSMVDAPDLFGRPLKVTTVNIADALAASAALMMGEASERCPLAVIEHSDLSFADTINPSEVRISMEEDLYSPFFKHAAIKRPR